MIDFPILDHLFTPDLESNHPHSGDKPDAAAIAVPPAPSTTPTGADTDPDARNEIAIIEDTYETALAPLAQSDSRMDRIEGHLAALQLMLAKAVEQPEELSFTTLKTGYEYIVKRQGRRYFALLAGGVVGCTANILGLALPFTLRPGWNPLNFPDGTAITTVSGTAPVVIRLSNWQQPDDDVLTVSSVATALSSPPANTNANSDTTLTFAATVQHWTLQNNSAANFYYNPDAAATTGSLVLAPGAQAFYDWPVTAVHVLTPSAIPVNGSGGLALVGRL